MIKYIIQEIIDWAPSFSLLEIVTQKECFFWFIWVLKISLRLTLIQRGGLCPLTLSCIMSQNGQTDFKNLAANAARSL